MSGGDVRLEAPMERIEAELFTDGGNDAVVRVPDGSPESLCRATPLHVLRSDVAEVVEACERGDLDEACDSQHPADLSHATGLSRWRSQPRRRAVTVVLSPQLGKLGFSAHGCHADVRWTGSRPDGRRPGPRHSPWFLA
ncbi:DUF6959 family protein [Streptomyces nigra]|uniref:DUF6959 family protein n=1 Tax=Streptomyces nigra TaxID=1827580 RepID=UPI0036BB64EA